VGHRASEQAYWEAASLEHFGRIDSAEEEMARLLESGEAFEAVRNRRQILMLILKSYDQVSEAFIRKAAAAIGMEEEVLCRHIEALRQLRRGKDQRRQEMRERVYSQYYRCLAKEKAAAKCLAGSLEREAAEARAKKSRKRLEGMRGSYGRMKASASNREVAEVLGMTKGAVDAAMYALRKKYGVELGRDEE
jgi:biotin operon repressor